MKQPIELLLDKKFMDLALKVVMLEDRKLFEELAKR